MSKTFAEALGPTPEPFRSLVIQIYGVSGMVDPGTGRLEDYCAQFANHYNMLKSEGAHWKNTFFHLQNLLNMHRGDQTIIEAELVKNDP